MKTVATLLITLALSATMLAQAPPAPPSAADRAQHHVQFMTMLLSLSSAQQKQATAIFGDAGSAAEPIHKSLHDAHQALQTAIRNNDTAGIDQAAATVGQLTSQMMAIHARSEAAFYQVLSAEQQAKLTQFQSQRPGPMGGPHHGPGEGD